ncbi:hypothetical protein B0181_06230 [Moraxella caviae]|uniref:Predicted membrane protein n=1 Tax=Moraxella caviae TaxID=34060 RepID=A0A1T0A1K6_9GAMM|nr:DUF997 family protein [Moraxella caviae]OOR89567.1 hypothetical protein B0181_06230 [Moraxella caviae]STZ10248.1 Predicted membrane protein [Moraxella caviae]VEW13249.1 Predicted membrane protein [Moraxella caviae]
MTKSQEHQLAKEAMWAVILTVFYLIGWVIAAYFSPDGAGFFGFPLWFEASCFYLPLLFLFVSFVVLKRVYQPLDLDAAAHDGTQPNDKTINKNNQ